MHFSVPPGTWTRLAVTSEPPFYSPVTTEAAPERKDSLQSPASSHEVPRGGPAPEAFQTLPHSAPHRGWQHPAASSSHFLREHEKRQALPGKMKRFPGDSCPTPARTRSYRGLSALLPRPLGQARRDSDGAAAAAGQGSVPRVPPGPAASPGPAGCPAARSAGAAGWSRWCGAGLRAARPCRIPPLPPPHGPGATWAHLPLPLRARSAPRRARPGALCGAGPPPTAGAGRDGLRGRGTESGEPSPSPGPHLPPAAPAGAVPWRAGSAGPARPGAAAESPGPGFLPKALACPALAGPRRPSSAPPAEESWGVTGKTVPGRSIHLFIYLYRDASQGEKKNN